ncbi:hypothetical protein AMECASPLE_005688 [Ameca splendens]|uniref:Uncharacterized protein n=1 Tax=Ameca splendens TaxID=208324 RepID=A0ABV0YLV9_9TELE
MPVVSGFERVDPLLLPLFIKKTSSLHASSANHPLTLRFKGPPVLDSSCSSAELDPPPPDLHQLLSNLLPVSSPALAFTPSPVGSQRGRHL